MSTIGDLCVTSSVSPDDKLPVWQNANGVTRALPISVLDGRYLSAADVFALAASPTTETFVSGTDFTPGVTTALTLQNQYFSASNIEVFFDTAFQGPDQYSLIGFGLAFVSPIPVGVQNVYVRGGSVRLTGAPSDGTVTDSKIASGSAVYNRIQTINVKDPQFGAKGNGVSDDSLAIQAAVTYAQSLSGGAEIYAPAGTYIISTPVQIAKIASKMLRFRGDGAATVFQAAASLPAGPMFNLGAGSSPAGGMDCIISSMMMQPGSNASANGFACLNMNGIRFEDVQFGALMNGVTMTACYAVRFKDCQWINTALVGIYSSTSAHNIILDSCKGFGVGVTTGQFLRIDGATNNIVIDKCDFEQCSTVYSLAAGSSSVRVTGTYIEYCVNLEFFHQGPCYSIVVDGCWIALNSGGGGISTYQNWVGGEFKNNTLYQMTVNWDAATVADVDVGLNYLAAGASVGPTSFSGVSLLNNWTTATHTSGYKKRSNGTVEIRGNVTAGSSSLGATAFVLPVAYRPAQQRVFATTTPSGQVCWVIVDPNGNVVPNRNGGSPGDVVNLDGIAFSANG